MESERGHERGHGRGNQNGKTTKRNEAGQRRPHDERRCGDASSIAHRVPRVSMTPAACTVPMPQF